MFPEHTKRAIDEFKYILQKYILPLIPVTGKLILKNHEEKRMGFKKYQNKYLKRYPSKSYINIYPCLETPQIWFRIDLEQDPNLGVAEAILKEIMQVSTYIYSDNSFPYRSNGDNEVNPQKAAIYRDRRYDLAFEIGLCNWFGGPSLFNLLSKIQKWSQKTYEGKKIPFSFLYDFKNSVKGIEGFETLSYIDFLDSNHSAAFTDGISSALALTFDGCVYKYKSPFSDVEIEPSESNRITFAPYRFREFADYCGETEIYSVSGNEQMKAYWLGVIAQTNGDILIFKKRSLVFMKKNGEWLFVDEYRIRKHISEMLEGNEEEREIKAKDIFLSLLDVSFSHCGGCLAIIKKEHLIEVKDKYVSKDDDIENDYSSNNERNMKKQFIKAIIKAGCRVNSKSFFNIDRKLRHELLSLDGATVIDSEGNCVATGAIVRVEGGSDGGGRQAAAKQLSILGLAIKISTDGKIEGYKNGELLFSVL